MGHIKISKGLDIPMSGRPPLHASAGVIAKLKTPSILALNLTSFDDIKFRLLVNVGDVVKIGQHLVEDKECQGRVFISPAAGVVKEIRRGAKRSLQSIVIEVDNQESSLELIPIDIQKASREDILSRLLTGGCFALIRSRPFNRLADPTKIPRSIFVKAIESAPCCPPAELQILGHEDAFQLGLDALAKLTSGKVHLVYHHETPSRAFTDARSVEKHTAEGPHPIANQSVHIQNIDPITSVEDVIWTLTALDVVVIGQLLKNGTFYNERVISIAGPGIMSEKIGYFKLRNGYPIEALIAGRVKKGELRFISGDPLMGHKVNGDEFLGFYSTVFCVIPENTEREFLHFMGLGIDKYSFSGAYLSGHLNNAERDYEFTTNQHGEHRAFVDSTLYDKVMPLNIPTMLLVKSVMAEDFEQAELLGLLEVDSEDFALPTFVCPSKMEMTEIMSNGLKQYAKEIQ